MTPAHGVAHRDEPRWQHGHPQAGCWGAGTTGGPVVVGRLSRGGQGVRARVGETVAGILGTDRSRAATGAPGRWRPLGWAQRPPGWHGAVRPWRRRSRAWGSLTGTGTPAVSGGAPGAGGPLQPRAMALL